MIIFYLYQTNNKQFIPNSFLIYIYHKRNHNIDTNLCFFVFQKGEVRLCDSCWVVVSVELTQMRF